MPRAGNLPLALLLRGRRLRVVDDIGARVAVKQPVGHVQPTHFRNTVPAVQEDVRQQPLALEIIFKLLLRLFLRHDERNHLFRLHAALEAVGQDGRAAAVGALGGGGGILGHQLRAAVLAVIDLHAFLARLKPFLRPLEHDLFAALRRVQHFQRFRLKAVPAGGAFQFAAFGQRPAAAGAVVTGCTHTCILLSCCTCCNRGYFPVSSYLGTGAGHLTRLLRARLIAVFAAHRAALSLAVLRAAARTNPLHILVFRRIQLHRPLIRVDLQVLQVAAADERPELLGRFGGGKRGLELIEGQAFLRRGEQRPRDAPGAGAPKIVQTATTGIDSRLFSCAFFVRYGFVVFPAIIRSPPPDTLQTPRRDRRRR